MLSLTNITRCCLGTTHVVPISVTSVRYFSPKSWPMFDGTYRGQAPRRLGYEAHHHTKGLLPRLSIKEKRLNTLPLTAKEDPWSKRLATMGENDFIRILGDKDIEQHELLTHIPEWLRGYKGTWNEYNVILRRKKEFEHWQHSKPLKWFHLERRQRFLYKMINNKFRPPEVEKLTRSRHQLG